MKTFKSAWLLIAVVSLLSIACQKEVLKSPPVESEFASCLNPGGLLPPIALCSPKTVPLCLRTGSIGTVTVGTGIDGKIYVTYNVTGNWYFKTLRLYAGTDAGIPVNSAGNAAPGNFPYGTTFTTRVQQYTFVLTNLPDLFTLAAYASFSSSNHHGGGGNGEGEDEGDDNNNDHGSNYDNGNNDNNNDNNNENDNNDHGNCSTEVAWGDGCSGIKINAAGTDWATKFTYVKGSCIAAAAVQLCSYLETYYFVSDMLWPDVNGLNSGNVTVGGFDYTEAEGRAIYNTPNTNGVPDSKNGFIQVTTLKLSHTNYNLQADLLLAVTTIENWLMTCGKLSPTNLPTGNQAVRDAANFLHTWIVQHDCGIR